MHPESKHKTLRLTSLPKEGGVSCFGSLSGRSSIQFLTVHSVTITGSFHDGEQSPYF